ncbi:hypothetical protein BOTNAR_0504g00050 [Botryotinia narcissicola]|uniref:Zn(2)-C6 fungal-type domain-containing protein n=1 Tax=Botryotinia narcissicola TaxID=278944 RepID=A0A4Z1HS82_9HELO|nr:hypothetical protein BOTNAR_0504g00050 [Botryotinia narcissicola]
MTDPLHNTYPRSPIPSTSSYDSSSVSSATSPRPQGLYEGGLMGASPRPMTGNIPHPQHMAMTSGLPPPGQSSFHHSYSSATTSPGGMGMDSIASNGSKDPNCDACRERKVKCDATETSSCSECSSRNVKCQFTKETNRRMSSIKQVQDLEKQIAQVKRENNKLRAMLSMKEDQMDVDEGSTSIYLPEIGSQPKKRPRAPLLHDFHGIFKTPAPYRQIGSPINRISPPPELPPKHLADHLLRAYYSSIHLVTPILHWPNFEREYEEVYKKGSLETTPRNWAALFFAVMAVGVLFSTEPSIQRPYKGKEYIEVSINLTDLWNDDYCIDHARTVLLTSIFLYEMNLKSAAWTWLGSSVRIGQDLGLHCETGPWQSVEDEMRRRVWWGIYIWDRHMSLEFGRPLLIDDADCDVNLPNPIDEFYLGYRSPPAPQNSGQTSMPSTYFFPIIHTMRAIGSLLKTLKLPIIPPWTISTFDTYFTNCLSAFPPPFHLSSSDPLESTTLVTIYHLLNERLLLHRHNLTTSSPPDLRASAIESCILDSMNSASILSRALPQSSTSPLSSQNRSWGQSTSAMICMHIWRCTLFLLFGGRFDAAATCIRALAYVGFEREVNVACGRYIGFFLGVLIDKKRSSDSKGREQAYLGQSSTQRIGRFDMDEEVVAYLSGDLQGGDESWIWKGREEEGMRSPNAGGAGVTSPTLSREGDRDREMGGMSGLGGGLLVLGEEEARDWGGWERVQYLVEILARESNASGPVPGSGPLSGHGQGNAYLPEPRGVFGLGLGVAPGVVGGMGGATGGSIGASGMGPISAKPQTSPPPRREDRNRGNERMSITNII